MKQVTSREMKVLELIGQGFSSGEIAFTLQISAHTVDSHRKSLMTKFDAKNAAELVRKAIQKNVLSNNHFNPD